MWILEKGKTGTKLSSTAQNNEVANSHTYVEIQYGLPEGWGARKIDYNYN